MSQSQIKPIELANHISSLINYYIKQNLITELDIDYTFNQVASFFNENEISYQSHARANLYDSIDYLSKYAELPEVLEAQITNVFLDRPTIINNYFNSLDTMDALSWFYNLGVITNYIKIREISKNKHFYYNNLHITINLSKPEKDPKQIAKLKQLKSSSYPQCPLCISNVGFIGNEKQAPRANHRVINLELANNKYFMQYSPYMYYNNHLIIISEEHTNMTTTYDTIKEQIAFVDKYDKLFIGNNADLPIVGGSILNHNHYQGGDFDFPIRDAKREYLKTTDTVDIYKLDWYLATIELSSLSKTKLTKAANSYLDKWLNYSNERILIVNNKKERHNAVNFITFKQEDKYHILIIFRNNYTTEQFPYGVFHPNEKLHHIKKENIGLIEAMGLAILPGRLDLQIAEFEKYLLKQDNEVSEIHLEWLKSLTYNNQDDVHQYVLDQIGLVFEQVLEDCNVFKYDLSEFNNFLGE